MRGVRDAGAILLRLHASPLYFLSAPNGVRYPLVGGTRERYFIGTHFKPRKLPENAQTPQRQVHALLGAEEKIQMARLKAK